MNPNTEKVLQRLVYEGLLISDDFTPQKRRITLEDTLLAGREEPRVLEVLPAMILFKPSILKGLEKDLKKNPEIFKFVAAVREGRTPKPTFLGLDSKDCFKAAEHFQRRLRAKKLGQKSLVLNLRLSAEDFENLKKVTRSLNSKSLSETLRQLVAEKAGQMGPG